MVSIHRPLDYGPSTLPLRQAAVSVRIFQTSDVITRENFTFNGEMGFSKLENRGVKIFRRNFQAKLLGEFRVE